MNHRSRLPQLVSQAPNMGIHCSRVQIRLISPNLAQKCIPRLNRPRPADQKIQQTKFCGGKSQFFASDRYRHRAAIELDPPRTNRSRLRSPLIRLTPSHRPHPQKQLPRTKRFGHIIIRPHLKPSHLVTFRGFCRQHQNRNSRRRRIPS